MSKSDSFVSVCLVIDDHLHRLDTYVTALPQIQGALAEEFVDHELVVVRQGNGTPTSNLLIQQVLHTVPGIRFLQLAYRVATDVAVGAALENAIGDFVVLFDPTQDPVDALASLVAQCKNGDDIVVGVAPGQPYSFGYRILRPLMGRLVSVIGYDLPRHATSLRCLSRRAVNAATRAGRFHHQLYVRIQKTGMPWGSYTYTPIAHARTKTAQQGIKEALRLLVFNSTKPLRWMNALGIGVSLISIAGCILLSAWQIAHNEAGAQTMLVPILGAVLGLMFLLLFTMTAFFGEYLGRLLDDRGESSLYSVALDLNSSVMLNENRENVLHET